MTAPSQDDLKAELGRLLRECREAVVPELKIPPVAEVGRVTPDYLGLIERGKRRPSVALLKKIAPKIKMTDEQLQRATLTLAASWIPDDETRKDMAQRALAPARRLHKASAVQRNVIPWGEELADDPTFLATWRVVGSIYRNRKKNPQDWEALLSVLKIIDKDGHASIPPEESRQAVGRGPSNVRR